MLFPTKLNEEPKPHMVKDFDMDFKEDGKTLKVILTRRAEI
jgi:hypothetical protein